MSLREDAAAAMVVVAEMSPVTQACILLLATIAAFGGPGPEGTLGQMILVAVLGVGLMGIKGSRR